MLFRPLAHKIKTAVNGFIDDLVQNKLLLLSFASAERSSQVRDCAIIAWRGVGKPEGEGHRGKSHLERGGVGCKI